MRGRGSERLERTAAGEGLLRGSSVAARLESREAWAAPRDRQVAGEAVRAHEPAARRVRGVVETGQPAPLLMRIMKRKATLEPGARNRVEGRAALEERPERVRPDVEVALAMRDHVTADPSERRPQAGARERAPRGLRVPRVGELR